MQSQNLDIANFTNWYNDNKLPFTRYLCAHFPDLDKEDVEDIYQESVLALYNNIRSKKLERLTCSLSTYLLQIGINKAHTETKNIIKRKDTEWDKVGEDDTADNERQKKIYHIIEQMESHCRDILFGYYYDCFSMSDLAIRLNYKDASVAKSTKYKCLQKLKNFINITLKKK